MAYIAQPTIDWAGGTNPDGIAMPLAMTAIIPGSNVQQFHVIPAPQSTQLAPPPAVGYATSG